MQSLNEIYIAIEPVGTTFIFELKKQWKKLIAFMTIAVGFAFLGSFLPYLLAPDNPLPATLAEFIKDSLSFITMIIIFSTCFFFGGIIVSEFSDKTGHIVFPIINRYKVILGKYLGAFFMEFIVLATYYITLIFMGLYYYGGPVPARIINSFLTAILYMLAVSAFVAMFSSFMKSVNMTIVATIMILLIVNMMVDALISLSIPEFEPVYSLNYMSNLIEYTLEAEFPKERFVEFTGFSPGPQVPGGGSRSTWITPSAIGGITIALAYFITCMSIALIKFSRKQF